MNLDKSLKNNTGDILNLDTSHESPQSSPKTPLWDFSSRKFCGDDGVRSSRDVTQASLGGRRKARPASDQMQSITEVTKLMATTENNKLRSIAAILGIGSIALVGVTACDDGGDDAGDDDAGTEEEVDTGDDAADDAGDDAADDEDAG